MEGGGLGGGQREAGDGQEESAERNTMAELAGKSQGLKVLLDVAWASTDGGEAGGTGGKKDPGETRGLED